jgi:Zn-dependent M16 (insulinase) family peptidase
MRLMSRRDTFETITKREIPELKTRGRLIRHRETGAEILSLSNDDENKVFGITFRTPPSDSTGVAHILEHAVLCGSRKYPVKEPFVELLKGSLQTFLNAFTYPDKTCYPVASQNVEDFYHLIDVYLDAVFYPRITPHIFQQEGWHYEMERPDGEIIYKGVVFNEMKGAYSSPDNLLAEYAQQSLFPDNSYGFDSGGNPSRIPTLTYDRFKAFHSRYYHPSNARIFLYGDDDPEERLRLLGEYLNDFTGKDIDADIPLQPAFKEPKRLVRPFPAGQEGGGEPKGMMTVNWLLAESSHPEMNFACHILNYILLGMPGSPLRKALIDSGLGEDLAGGGLADELRQMYFSTGLKGIDIARSDKIESIILETMNSLAREGIHPHTVEAALNSIEFNLREINTGSFPRGLVIMLRALNTWLYDDDPFALIAFEKPLNHIKHTLQGDPTYFEKLLDRLFIQNPHRTILILEPDLDLAEKQTASEKARLQSARSRMSDADLEEVIRTAGELRKIQETPDSPEDLAKIPMLKLTDLERENKKIPLIVMDQQAPKILRHDLFTSGIVYLDVGFDLHALPQKYLPYIRLFGRALLEMGTETEDYVTLSQRINRKTGGIFPAFLTSSLRKNHGSTAWMFLRGKAMTAQSQDLLDIIQDVLMTLRLDNRERFRQMVLEAKARQEQQLVPMGHRVVNLRLRAHFTEADWAAEQISGISFLIFLRRLAREIETSWDDVLDALETIRQTLTNRRNMIVNVTLEEAAWDGFKPELDHFFDQLPDASPDQSVTWDPEPIAPFEGMTIPAQVNYVGKGASLYELGYQFHGSAHVIGRFLRNGYLWDRIRVQGGAYGAFCLIDRLSGIMTFLSYRDPNLLKTLDVFDQSADFLRDLHLSEDELNKSIIGAIGEMDKPLLPDAAGHTSMIRYLTRESDESRQRVREEIMGTRLEHFTAFADILNAFRDKGLVKVLGAPTTIEKSMEKNEGWLDVMKIL